MPARAQYEDEFLDDEYEDSPRDGQRTKAKTRRLLLDLLGRWYWIILGLILGVLGAAYYVSKAPKVYTASSTLLLKTQTGSIMSQDQVADIDLRSIEAMNTAVARITRMDLLERVASRQDVRDLPGLIPPSVDWLPEWAQGDDLGIDQAPTQVPPAPALAGRIAGWLDVSVRRYTRLVDISITHQVPEVSKALADAIAREYLAEVQSEATEGRSGAIELLVEESEETREVLQTARTALSSYARALEVHQALDKQESVVAQLERRYLPAHPKMEAANLELEHLRERFIREFELARTSPSDSHYWDNVRQKADANGDPETYVRSARQQLLARIGVLESELESQTNVFNAMLTRIEESSVNQESEESSAEVSSLARVPGWPSAPVANKIYMTGGGAGFAFGLAIAFLLTKLDNKYHTVAQLEGDTDTTVLAAVADIKPHHLAQAERRYYKKHPDESPEPYADWDTHLVFRPGCSTTSYAEMYRVLRASISLLGDESKRKVTLFTSALPGEGKTSTSTNFAMAAAGQKRRTLLIDLDLRRPSVHKMFNMERDPEGGGITQCLAGINSIDEVVRQAPHCPNLHMIVSGPKAPNPGELLDTGRLRQVLLWACHHYDVVVLDTAPLLAVPDTRIIAPLADNVCLVVRAHYAPKGAIGRVMEVVEEDRTPLSGVIFNGFREKKTLVGQNYSYGYYRTSRYGRSYGYGYGGYGAYGAYGADDDDDSGKRKRRRNKRRRRIGR